MTIFTETNTGNAQTVNELRKNGNLQDAFLLASTLMESDATNIWNRRAMAWVGIEYLKESIDEVETTKWILQLIDLKMAQTDGVFWEQFRWRVGSILFQYSKNSAALPDWLMPFLISLPRQSCKAHSFVLRAILKYITDATDLSGIVIAWDWNLFTAEDFISEKLPNGKTIPALAERTYSAVAKYHLNSRIYKTDQVAAFIEELAKQAHKHPDWLYVVYYQALLLQKLNRTSEAKDVALPFIRRKPNEFWVWDLLGTLCAEDPKVQQACYARAMCCKAPETFLLNVRQKLAKLLIGNGRWSEARVEIEALYQTRVMHNWKVPGEVIQWVNSTAYRNAVPRKNNDDLYTSLRKPADLLLLDKDQKYQGVIWKINKEKQTASFFVDEQIYGGFSYARLGVAFEVGEVVELYLEKVISSENQYYKVAHVTPFVGIYLDNQIRSFAGRIFLKGPIGFVGDVFISAELLGVTSGASACQGEAVRTFDQKRNVWGWKAFCLK